MAAFCLLFGYSLLSFHLVFMFKKLLLVERHTDVPQNGNHMQVLGRRALIVLRKDTSQDWNMFL